MLPPSGFWCGRLSQVGQTDWFNFPVRGNRTFTIVTEALDETGQPSNFKAMPVLGIWDAFAAPGTAAGGRCSGPQRQLAPAKAGCRSHRTATT